MMNGYETVIGLEIHVQLATRTKLFCGDIASFGGDPNTRTCPVCLGLPGALPVLNGAAVALAVRAAAGLDCVIHETSVFARKNYFYPDLPKGYQITQFDRPIATEGWLDVGPGAGTSGDADSDGDGDGSGDGAERVRIRRIHLEEDAGKSIHDRLPGRTAIDLNRAGVPLVEIVTEPDVRSPAHARAFLARLKRVLEYLEVSDCDMEKGSLRVDANLSLRPAGTVALGTKTEVKNLNSFSNVERALVFEAERQARVLDGNGVVVQETLLWDARAGEARPVRSKEESHDYRYFPEPDLPPLVIGRRTIEAARDSLPELPDARARRFREAYGLPAYDADVLTASRPLAAYFEAVAAAGGDPKAASNWVMTDVLAWSNENRSAPGEFPVPPDRLGRLIALVDAGTLSNTMARQVLTEMAETGRTADEIVEAEGLAQIADASRLGAWADELVAAHPTEVERYRAGDTNLMGFFMGRIMKRSEGKADPRKASEVLTERLKGKD